MSQPLQWQSRARRQSGAQLTRVVRHVDPVWGPLRKKLPPKNLFIDFKIGEFNTGALLIDTEQHESFRN